VDPTTDIVRGNFSIVDTERSQNGALFYVLENAAEETFLVPADRLLSTLRHLFGTRSLKLHKRSYYGREVYEPM
jgi:hypothetical protein